ncbi:MAG: chromate transporter [Clostridia bacterium]
MILAELFFSFLQVGLFSIGGGYAALPLIQHQVVEAHTWLTMSEFTDLITIAEMTPGPIAVNSATFVGIRIAGVGGALIATLGCILPSMLIVSMLAYVYNKYKSLPALQSVLSCLRAAVVALIAAAGLSILQLVALNGAPLALSNVQWIGLGLFLAAFVALRKWKWNPILVMGLCGAGGLALHALGLGA